MSTTSDEHHPLPGRRWGDDADACGTGGRDFAIGEVVRMEIRSYPPMTVLIVGRSTNTHDPVIAHPAERGTWVTTLPDDAAATVVARAGSPMSLRFAAELRARALSDAADALLDRAAEASRDTPDHGLPR